MKPTIKLKRVYNEAEATDGFRVLVDRRWPRGMKKEQAELDAWIQDIAPTEELRKQFDHKPERWPEFKKLYREELKKNEAVEGFVKEHSNKKTITLLFAAKDEDHNNAIVLQKFLEEKFS